MGRLYLGLLFAVMELGSGAEASGQIVSKEDFMLSTTRLVQEGDIPGMAVAVVDAKGGRWAYGFGYADLEAQKPMTPDTVIAIASISKLLTGVAAMQAVEKGLIDLDGDINDYLPFTVINPKNPNHRITLRHVLTHTTGVVDYQPLYNSAVVYHGGADSSIMLSDFLREYLTPEGAYYSVTDNFSEHAPGAYYSYSNIMYALAGYMVEHVSGQAFHEYARTHILMPLRMETSVWRLADVNPAVVGKQYGKKDAPFIVPMQGQAVGLWRAYQPYSLTTYPDGGLRTSVTDLSHFLVAVLNGGVYEGQCMLKAETLGAMLTPQRFGDGKMPGLGELEDQGLAFAYEPPALLGADWIMAGHAGGDPGVTTGMYFDLQNKVGFIFFINAEARGKKQLVAAQEIVKNLLTYGTSFLEE